MEGYTRRQKWDQRRLKKKKKYNGRVLYMFEEY